MQGSDVAMTNGFSRFPTGAANESNAPDDVYAAIGPTTPRKAEEWVFVLRSVGIEGFARRIEGGAYVVVVTRDVHAKAVETLRTYEIENRDFPPRAARDRPLYGRSPWAIATVLGLCAFFLVTGPARMDSPWFRHGIADAAQMLHGAPWQAVTALTLHADAGHVLGNAISGGVFFGAVHRRLGAGLGTFVVLVSSIGANALNALEHLRHGVDHRSLGASTAVFAAIGVLAAAQLLVWHEKERKWTNYAGPIAGAIVLLGTLGAGGRSTDLLAHGFGLLTGFAAGLATSFVVGRRRPSGLVQASFGFASVAIVAASWALAFARG